MARKKKNRQVKSAPEQGGVDVANKREAAPIAKSSDQTESGPENQPACAPRRQVGLGTCLGGMFLCLVLGVYIGTLLPDILAHHKLGGQIDQAQNVADSANSAVSAMPQANPSETAPQVKVRDIPVGEMPQGIKTRITQLEGIVTANPTDSGAWTELGNLFFDTGQVEKSIHAYEHSLKLAPNNADVLTDLGIMYRESGNTLKAVECFRKATAINPAHLNALFNEGVVLSSDLGDKAGAKEAWEKLLKINPDASGPDGKPVREMIQGLR